MSYIVQIEGVYGAISCYHNDRNATQQPLAQTSHPCLGDEF